ncbi:CPBP family intramembrane glutamic endopeptidase [Planctomycetota bacterium]
MTRKRVQIPVKAHQPSDPYGGALLNVARDSYLERTSRPIYAVVFLLPFIALYELGTLLINTDVLSHAQIRVVAFVWLQDLLGYLGYAGRLAWVAPPLVVIVILIGLQVSSRKPWYVSLKDLAPMAVECVLLAIPLIVLSLLFNSPAVARGAETATAWLMQPWGAWHTVWPLQASSSTEVTLSLWASIVTGVGAGIYEELVFRLILICLLMVIFQDLLGLTHKNAVVLSILVSAALFSAHHHVVFVNGSLDQTAAFSWTAFGFRTLAGIYFAILFAARGFGITAGTHAFYDILATLLNTLFFRA